jgi:hypothetical protein
MPKIVIRKRKIFDLVQTLPIGVNVKSCRNFIWCGDICVGVEQQTGANFSRKSGVNWWAPLLQLEVIRR